MIDAENRITLVVGTEPTGAACGQSRTAGRSPLLVRLTGTGALDPSFGEGGKQSLEPLRKVSALSFDRSGGLVLAGPVSHACSKGPELAVLRLRSDGGRRRGFGPRGTRRITGSAAALAVDQRGRITVLCKEKRKKGTVDEHLTKLVRMLPSGAPDPSFDRNGVVVYEFKGPLYKWSSLLVDGSGRLLLVGTLIRPLPVEKQRAGKLFHRWFMAVPISEDGKHFGGFEGEGWISYTRFGPRSDAAASDALIDREGELMIAGTTQGPGLAPKGGFALARLELWK